MARPLWRIWLALAIGITLLGGCERKQRAREREALAAQAKARARAQAAARRAAMPLAQEPPVDTLRVANSGFPCKVDDVFAAKCRRCHTIPPRHAAPFVFLTWDDLRQERAGQRLPELIGRAVRSNFMPQRIEANPPVLPLTDDERKIILDWVDAGAPRENCDPNAPVEKKTSAKVIKSGPSPHQRRAEPPVSAQPKR